MEGVLVECCLQQSATMEKSFVDEALLCSHHSQENQGKQCSDVFDPGQSSDP